MTACNCNSPYSIKSGSNNSDDLLLYPNPASEMISLRLPLSVENNSLKIVNQSGQVLRSLNVTNDDGTLIIDTANFTNGVYYLNYIDKLEGIKNKLLIINH